MSEATNIVRFPDDETTMHDIEIEQLKSRADHYQQVLTRERGLKAEQLTDMHNQLVSALSQVKQLSIQLNKTKSLLSEVGAERSNLRAYCAQVVKERNDYKAQANQYRMRLMQSKVA